MRTTKTRAALVTAAAVGSLALLATPASAATSSPTPTVYQTSRTQPQCVGDTDGDCFRPNYHIQRTDGTLAGWSGPGPGNGQVVVGSVGGNGAAVEVVCETNGTPVDGQPYTVWDQLDDGVWVYGYYLDTPGDGFHPQLGCPG